jgi:hypothetical protein
MKKWHVRHAYLEMALDMSYAKPSNVHELKNKFRSCTYTQINIKQLTSRSIEI